MGKPVKSFDERSHASVRMDDDVKRLFKRVWELSPVLQGNISMTLKLALEALVIRLETLDGDQPQRANTDVEPTYNPLNESSIKQVVDEPEETDNWQDEDP